MYPVWKTNFKKGKNSVLLFYSKRYIVEKYNFATYKIKIL